MLDDARVEYIFVLMLENRSFDQMLGFSNIQGTEVVTGTSPVIPSRVSVISTPSHTHPAALSTRVWTPADELPSLGCHQGLDDEGGPDRVGEVEVVPTSSLRPDEHVPPDGVDPLPAATTVLRPH